MNSLARLKLTRHDKFCFVQALCLVGRYEFRLSDSRRGAASENDHQVQVEFRFRIIHFVVTSSIKSSVSVVFLKFGVAEDTEWTSTPGPEEGALSDSASVGLLTIFRLIFWMCGKNP